MTATAATGKRPEGVLATLRATPPAARYLLGGILINQAGAFVQMFLVLYLIERGLPVERAGTALAVYSGGAVLGLVLGGELAHRIGARATIAVSMAGSAAFVLLVPTLSHPGRFGYLLVVVAGAGAATSAYRPAAAALLSDVMPAEYRVMAFSMLRIALNIGAALGPLLAAGLILVDWDLLFYVDGVTALAYAALALALLPAPGSVAAAGTPGAAAGPGDVTSAALSGRAGYRVLVRDTPFLFYLASMLLSAVVYGQLTTALPLKIDSAGQPPALYSTALVVSSVILILCELKITTYVRHWVPAVAAAIGTTLMTVGISGYAFAGVSPALVILATVVFVSGLMISGPTLWAHPAKAPGSVKGRYIGASQAAFGLGSASGPVVGVFAWTRWGDGVWLLCLVVGLVAAACAGWGMRSVTPAAPERAAAQS